MVLKLRKAAIMGIICEVLRVSIIFAIASQLPMASSGWAQEGEVFTRRWLSPSQGCSTISIYFVVDQRFRISGVERDGHAMRLKGGLGEDTLAVLRELEDSEGDDEEYIPAGKSGDAERKMRQIIAEMSTNTSWAKLREYVESWIAEGGQDEVDTEGVSTFGPHTDPEYWTKLSRGPFAWWKIPWEQRPLIGTLEMPNGDVLDLREGAWRPSAPLPLLTTVIPPRWPLVPREPAPLPRVRRAITRPGVPPMQGIFQTGSHTCRTRECLRSRAPPGRTPRGLRGRAPGGAPRRRGSSASAASSLTGSPLVPSRRAIPKSRAPSWRRGMRPVPRPERTLQTQRMRKCTSGCARMYRPSFPPRWGRAGRDPSLILTRGFTIPQILTSKGAAGVPLVQVGSLGRGVCRQGVA